ncbi:MAG TPA: nucleotidyltransferase family protein [Paucimonas sp.]|nr:nucleotidyltransferase family protein [Paucimonas sp.]
MDQQHMNRIAGILLAAGKGSRFAPDGARNKLLQMLPGGDTVVAAAARNLRAALPYVLAVIRSGDHAMASVLGALDCTISECPTAEQGMGVSLVHGLTQARDAGGWVIALADMPHVQPATITALVNAIAQGADIAVPVCHGRRGNPVAFSRVHLPQLLQLGGDQGARSLLKTCAVTEVPVEDDGIFRDIDTPDDLDCSIASA